MACRGGIGVGKQGRPPEPRKCSTKVGLNKNSPEDGKREKGGLACAKTLKKTGLNRFQPGGEQKPGEKTDKFLMNQIEKTRRGGLTAGDEGNMQTRIRSNMRWGNLCTKEKKKS